MFVATFIGSPKMTLMPVERDGTRLGLPGAGSITTDRLPADAAGAVTLGARPDALRLGRGVGDGFSATVIYTEYLGDNAYVYARLADGTLVTVRTAPGEGSEPDTPAHVSLKPGGAHFFSRADGRRLDSVAST